MHFPWCLLRCVAIAGACFLSSLARADTPALPFDLPPYATLQATGGKVFAHYWPPMPLSIDNKDAATDPSAFYARYNNPNPNAPAGGTAYPSGAEVYGGHLRDQPIGLPPGPTTVVNGVPQWRLDNAKEEVRRAIAGGLDGFALDMIVFPGGSDTNQIATARALCTAAPLVDPNFKIMLMLDMNGAWASYGYIDEAGAASFINELADRAAGSAFTQNGKLVISTFKADAKAPAFYTSLFARVQAQSGRQVTFIADFLSDTAANESPFTSICDGMGFWGDRDPANTNRTNNARVDRIQAFGKQVFYPVSIQDERPSQHIFDESLNTGQLRASWAIARAQGVELVQIPTWNDYTEGAMLCPTKKRGWGFLDLNAYFLTWYKTGSPPAVVRDTVYVTHRTQLAAATPTSPYQTVLMTQRSGSTLRDAVEAVAFLTAPATVRIATGGVTTSFEGAAGMNVFETPVRTGMVRATVARGGVTTTAVTSPNEVSVAPVVQDEQYVIASSRRTQAGAPILDPVTFGQWQGVFFSPAEIAAGLAAADQDASADGVVNLVEYALGLDPRANNSGALPVVTRTGVPAALQITFERDAAKTDLDYLVESSQDLFLWTTVTRSTAGSPTVVTGGAGSVVETGVSGTSRSRVTVSANPPVTASQQFLHLRVTRP